MPFCDGYSHMYIYHPWSDTVPNAGLMQDLCAKYGIPTASYAKFSDAAAAKEYIRSHSAPIVVKANGLAAGKGVVVAQTVEEACEAVDDMLLQNKFGDAGETLCSSKFCPDDSVSFRHLAD